MTRRALRESIFRILFRYEFNDVAEMEEQIGFFLDNMEDFDNEDNDELISVSEPDRTYIHDKSVDILGNLGEIDSTIERISDGWRIDRIGKAELAILRVAIYEMEYDTDVPFKVAINEALELAKKYCTNDAKNFINALLSKVED